MEKKETDLKPKIETIKSISISKEMESSFIDYAMSVIVSRAIPDARDGLKPVHRRIIYAMYGLDMVHNRAFKKSARAVGEVIAKYHPHGDSSVYEALVRMAQPFSLRYPLVWGQGNFGSIDGDSAAAMRYTEAKLHKITVLLTNDLKKNTVDFQLNYDDSEQEPKVLPATIPNLLLNGSTGIAVGMATSIPPHNLEEVMKAAIALAKNPELETKELMNFVKAPDFPTAGIIVNANDIPQIYATGKGRIIVRSRTEVIFDEIKNKGKIIITEIPYMVNKSNLILKIADLVKGKTLESISDIRDESSRKGIRIVIKLKRGYIPEVELNKLFKLTQLQSNFPVNMIALVNERPKLLSLKSALNQYIDHQIDILLRKTSFSLEKDEARKHILEGMEIALKDITKIINLIKSSKTNAEATKKLIETIKLSELQAKAILEMRLQRLTGLEQANIVDEIKILSKQIENNNLILNDKEVRTEQIIKMIKEIINKYGDKRLTEISTNTLHLINDEDLIPMEDIAITLTKNGYIKRIPIKQYRAQNRGGQGSRGVTTNDGDYVTDIIIANTHTDIMFFSSLGKVYRLRAHSIPQLGKIAKGLPIINLIDVNKNEKINTAISISNYDDTNLFFVTKNGIIKKTLASDFQRVNKNGKIAISLRPDDQLLKVSAIPNNEEVEIVLGNKNGKAIRFKTSQLRTLGRTASGFRGMNVGVDGEIVDYGVSINGANILSVSENGFGKITPTNQYRLQTRGGKGVKTINTLKAGKLIGLRAVQGDEELLLITNHGTVIRVALSQVSKSSRNTKGVTIISPKHGEKIVSIATIKSSREVEKEIIEQTQEIVLNGED
ncbi:MAG: DNA gyrase subunit A [Mycoplasmataceae bacterium]|nr:DNA gyrase subunit A [Mycoplasmataceae bacterium]